MRDSDGEPRSRIVLVEDEDGIRENYAELLADEGYCVRAFADRASAYAHLVDELADLIVLDIGLGNEYEGGIELYRQVRALSSSVPIIFLTSHDSESDRIKGMGLDIDDYITKKTSIDYLIVRIQTLFRRINELSTSAEDDHLIRRDDLVLDTDARIAYWQGTRVDISLGQYLMLQELAIRPGHVKSVGKLMVVAKLVVEPNTIVASIKSIRRKFREIDPGFDRIASAYGKGYRWLT